MSIICKSVIKAGLENTCTLLVLFQECAYVHDEDERMRTEWEVGRRRKGGLGESGNRREQLLKISSLSFFTVCVR
jgi:hypothetical protein